MREVDVNTKNMSAARSLNMRKVDVKYVRPQFHRVQCLSKGGSIFHSVNQKRTREGIVENRRKLHSGSLTSEK
jgi:hypothetical protein